MGNGKFCSCKESVGDNTESKVIKDDILEKSKTSKNEANLGEYVSANKDAFYADGPQAPVTPLKELISSFDSKRLQDISYNAYAAKITNFIRESAAKINSNPDNYRSSQTPNENFYDNNDILNYNKDLFHNYESGAQNDEPFLKGDKPSLRQTLKRSEESKYIGPTDETGSKAGFGIQEWKDGAKFVGCFRDNKANGYGLFLPVEGDKYAGEFRDDKLDGFGIYNHVNGAEYSGDWVNEMQEGIGVEKWRDGSAYEGEYANGKKEGIGSYVWKDGSKYEGMWRENNLCGYGIYYFNDGRIYEGQWLNNMMNGLGKFVWKDGKKYIGFYSNDKKEGFGIYSWPNAQKVFAGFWAKGKQNGIGKYMDSKRNKFGIWNNGKRVKWFSEYEDIQSFIDESQRAFLPFMNYSFEQISEYVNNF